MATSIIYSSFGVVHKTWMKNPKRLVYISIAYLSLLATCSILLKIGFKFPSPTYEYWGYIVKPNWFLFQVLIVPLCIFIICILFRLLDDALLSLDEIFIPRDIKSISEVLTRKFNFSWNYIIFPLSFLLSILSTIYVDGVDILSPLNISSAIYLKIASVLPSGAQDWTTKGAEIYADNPSYLYFLFNVLAFSVQTFLIYCGLLASLCTIYPLIIFGKYAIRLPKHIVDFENDINHQIRYNEILDNFMLKWKWADESGRCGLHKFDKVFFVYILLILVAVGIAIVSVVSNKILDSGIDSGSICLIVGTVFLLPAAFAWIIIPYWSVFPKEIPMKYKDKGYPIPSPWPFGSEKISWGLIGFAITEWTTLFSLGIQEFYKYLK